MEPYLYDIKALEDQPRAKDADQPMAEGVGGAQNQNGSQGRQKRDNASRQHEAKGRAQDFIPAFGIPDEITDRNVFQSQSGKGTKQTDEGQSETEYPELLRPQIAGQPDPDCEPHPHAQNVVSKLPADITDNVLKISPTLYLSTEEFRQELYPSLFHSMESLFITAFSEFEALLLEMQETG